MPFGRRVPPVPRAPHRLRSFRASALNPPGARASFGLRFPAPEGPRGPHAAVLRSEPRGPGGCAGFWPRRPGRGRGLAPGAPAGLRISPGWKAAREELPARGPRGRGCPGPGGRAPRSERVSAGEGPGGARGSPRGPSRNPRPASRPEPPGWPGLRERKVGGLGHHQPERRPRAPGHPRQPSETGVGGLRGGGGALGQCPGAARGRCGAPRRGDGGLRPGPFGRRPLQRSVHPEAL